MSLHPQANFDIPGETVKVARAAFPKGTLYMQMRDELGTIYRDEIFAPLYPDRGQPAQAPWRLALVTIMQFAENLTDRQAADAVRGRIDWKYALSLDLDDPGFDFSVLSEFRTRLLEGGAEDLLFEQMLALFNERGWVKARGRQRTDSTHILGAVRNLNRLEIVGETLHHALNILAQVAPGWLRAQIQASDQPAADWFGTYGPRFNDYRLPKAKGKRREMAEQVGRDGAHLLRHIYADSAPAYLRMLPAVDILRQVWIQHYYVENGVLTWREQKNFPPSSVMIASPYDVEVRYSQKRHMNWRGYKVHLSETCDEDRPHLITHVETTPATDQDVTAVEAIHQGLAERNLLPDEHLVDGAYMSSDVLVDNERDYGVDLVGPVQLNKSWQALTEGAFALDQFAIDWEQEVVQCPQGKPSRFWHPAKGPSGKPTIQVHFDKHDCAACEARPQCTRSQVGPRELTLHPKPQHLALEAARARQETDAFKKEYARRAGVEGTISEAVFARDMRRTRYRGQAKVHLEHLATASAACSTSGGTRR